MIKYCILILFLLLSRFSQAQFFDSSVHYLTIECRSVDDHGCSHSAYYLLLDSSNADTQYYQIKYTYNSNRYYKYLKVINRKVFIKTSADYSLLYDFGLKVGDTIKVLENMQELYGLIGPSSNYILDSITRVKLGLDSFNIHHVRIGNGLNKINFSFIDGIGSLENGLFYFDHFQFEDRSDLLTICKNGELLVYRNHYVVKSGQNTCNPIFFKVSINEPTHSSHLRIFPNPGNGLFTLDLDGFTIKVIQVLNATGQLVYNATSTTSNEMDLGQLSPGIYQVLVKFQGDILTQKLVIE